MVGTHIRWSYTLLFEILLGVERHVSGNKPKRNYLNRFSFTLDSKVGMFNTSFQREWFSFQASNFILTTTFRNKRIKCVTEKKERMCQEEGHDQLWGVTVGPNGDGAEGDVAECQ